MAGFTSMETLTSPPTTADGTPSGGGLLADVGALNDYESARAKQVEAAVVTPPPPEAFKGLRTGPDIQIEYDAQQAVPIEMSNALLRNLSPFMIQVEPPLAFGEDGGRLNGDESPGISPEIYRTAGASSVSLVQKARANLAVSGISGIDYTTGSTEEYVVQNSSAGTAKNPKGDGTLSDGAGNSTSTARLGKPAIADLLTAVDISMQLSAAMNTPPLVLLINPSNLQISISKIQQFQDRSRFGYIFHAWGEDQPKLTITAKCGAFVSGGRGVSFASKNDSVAWQNLMNAFTLYRSNGYIYDTRGRSNAHHFVGMLSIHYDGWVYYGHMGSFSYAYQDSQPNGGIEFSMEFVVSMMADTSSPSMAVLPMKAPMPSLLDMRYTGKSQNKSGEYAVGAGTDGLTLTTQGREVSPSEAFGTLLPQDATQLVTGNPDYQTPRASEIGQPKGVAQQSMGTDGFQSSSVSSPLTVTQAAPGRAQPFRR